DGRSARGAVAPPRGARGDRARPAGARAAAQRRTIRCAVQRAAGAAVEAVGARDAPAPVRRARRGGRGVVARSDGRPRAGGGGAAAPPARALRPRGARLPRRVAGPRREGERLARSRSAALPPVLLKRNRVI